MMLGPRAVLARCARSAPPMAPDPPPGRGKASPGFLSIEGI